MKFELNFLSTDGPGEPIPFAIEIQAAEWYDAWEVANRLAFKFGCRVVEVAEA